MDKSLQIPDHLTKPDSLDDQELVKLFNNINKRYFSCRINVKLVWQVPKGSVTVATGRHCDHFDKDSKYAAKLAQAKRYIGQHKLAEATPLLEACAQQNNAEAKLLLSHILRTLGRKDWQLYANEYNQHLPSVSAVPAACYYPATKTIALHPLLSRPNTPQYVLRYLIYHECCHQLIPCTQDNPHPKAFMEWENAAPNRARAISWLEKKGFPILD